METLNNKYTINIYERYLDLKKLNKPELDNNDLWKIFEYYSCLKLSEEYKKPFYEYDDIDPTFKELNKMSRNDTGIDLSDLDKTIVQCKLRKNTLTWKECSTFFGSQVTFNKELNKAVVRWENLIITRNNDCILSENLLERKELFIDKPFIKQELIKFCENLIINPPKYPVINNSFNLRDYQIESINMITQNKKNVIICLPTGTGKNSVIIHSFQENKKYLVLVPRIILMEQLKEEIIKHKPVLKNKIQMIGDTNNEFNENKLITICVFNSVNIVESHCNTFEKIYIDEAHHINKPEIYYYEDENENMEETKEIQVDNNNEENSNEELTDNENTDEEQYDDNEDDTENEPIDDTEDELKNVKSYTQIIKSLVQYNNNVYLSATIDKTDNFDYYSQDIRDMIEKGYLCDYTIHIPIFSEDPNNMKICEHLLKNYRNIIIYCNSQTEGKEINKLMNKLQNNSSEYIDCNTPKKKRNNIIEKYKKGEIPFLVNVRILVEGFDAPITKGVCFLHLPNNKTTLIQIIGRCLRLHSSKTIANIILPFSSKEDEKNIGNFLKVMAKNDSRIKKSYENKQLGGYISIDITEETEDENINDNIEFKYNMVYDNMGVLKNGEEIWMKRLEEVKKYIDEHNRKPTPKTNKKLDKWLSHQQNNYKKKEHIMKNQYIYNIWIQFITSDKYKIYFISNNEKWLIRFNDVKKYIDINNKIPSTIDKNKNIGFLGKWLYHQQVNYKNETQIMKEQYIYDLWTHFITSDKYKIYFMSNTESWVLQLEKVKIYIDTNNEKPTTTNENEEIRILGRWVSTQQQNYEKKNHIMKEENIYNMWSQFIKSDKYKAYFMNDIETWLISFEKVKKYIDNHNERPPQHNNNKEIKVLATWISTQQYSYSMKNYIMKKEEIYNLWTQFITSDKYKTYFINNTDAWLIQLEEVKKYIDTNNKTPSQGDENKEIKILSQWLTRQQTNYQNKKHIMKDENVYNIWTQFITSEKYKMHFISDIETWLITFEEVKKYIDINNKRPSDNDKDARIKKLGVWICNQQKSYKKNNSCGKKNSVMKEIYIYNIWTQFITSEKYKIHFISNKEYWLMTFEEVKKYIDTNNKRPSDNGEDIKIKILSKWLSHQTTNYKKKTEAMKEKDIYNIWTQFITSEKYKIHFMSNIESWMISFEEVKKYIDNNNKRPFSKDNNKEIRSLGMWIGTQLHKYKNKTQIMKEPYIYDTWTQFITSEKYKTYF
jgi:DNA repair protein RadD